MSQQSASESASSRPAIPRASELAISESASRRTGDSASKQARVKSQQAYIVESYEARGWTVHVYEHVHGTLCSRKSQISEWVPQ